MVTTSALPPEFDRGTVTTIHQGEFEVSGSAELTYSTVLGSCVAACVHDRVALIGGMNHFLLAEQSDSARDRHGASARYGAFAMEQLINRVLTSGSGKKSNLEIKVFGGGKINSILDDIGAKNVEFVRQFLFDEGYKLNAEDLGGSFARRVLFKPRTGRVFIKRLDSDVQANVAREEIALVRLRRTVTSVVNDIELF